MAASTPRPSELRGAEPTRALVWLLRASLVVLVAVGGVFLGHPPAIAVVAPTPTSSASTSYDVRGSVAHAGEVAVLRHRVGVAAREESLSLQGETARVSDSVVAANGGSRIAANQAAGNAARDRLLAAYPGALPEQSFTTTAGVRRFDILTQGLVGIESKVGRTSLTATTRSQIAKDSLLLRNGDVNGIEWVFSRSGVTGQIGPTGPLADALSKAGIPWSLAP